MWIYEKRLEYPVSITRPDPRMAKLLMAQYGGPDSELAAGLRYLTQRYSMPDDRVRATLTDIGTEEMAHWEMIAAMIHQCMQGASMEELTAAGLDGSIPTACRSPRRTSPAPATRSRTSSKIWRQMLQPVIRYRPSKSP